MNTKQMDYILELAQTQNFNRAAENLYTSQPTMTYQIKAAEEEVGFAIFERSGKGASLTPAGSQFVTELRSIRESLKRAIEHGQNFSARYIENIRLALPIRSCLYFLPDAISRFESSHPDIQVTLYFSWENCIDSFLHNDQDIVFAMSHEMKRVPDVNQHKLFDSHIYLITEKENPLAAKSLITEEDLYGRTLMVGGGSPPMLRSVQQRMIATGKIDYFNSQDHDTTLTNVASHKGVCLAPGFLNDHTGEFAWIPFDCKETIPCSLFTHKNDQRDSLAEFVRLLQSYYKNDPEFKA